MKENLWQRLFQGVRHLQYRSDWAQLAGADWPERIMEVAVTDRFHAKQGRSTGRWILQGQQRHLSVYLKRHYRLSWWRGLLAALWPSGGWSPAVQEWRHLEWAKHQGMPVPTTVAAGEYIGPWGRLQSFLAVEELAGMVPLHEAIPAARAYLEAGMFAQWKCGLAAELARLTRALHSRRYFHKDLYLCHFYIPTDFTRTQSQIHMIDLHRLAHHRWTRLFWQIKDLAQLAYSSEIEGVSAGDRLRFWRAYLGPGYRGRTPRLLGWLVRLKWRRYRRHNKKKQNLAMEMIGR
ncbi:MAG TPA: lipopolysaccharide kinase InaA family protein [Gemmataceae bacterium]|nr:lipopolysaccharide kinase InaA family protein [Gemmataceae bacterium]